jgi:TldD protein
MSALTKTDDLFFTQTGLDAGAVTRFVTDGLKDADGGELFLEYSEAESYSRSQQRTVSSSTPGTRGFGLRYIANGAYGFGTNNELSMATLGEALDTASTIKINGSGGRVALPPVTESPVSLYGEQSPLSEYSKQEKVDLLKKIDDYVRAKDPRIKQVEIGLAGSFQAVQIIRADGQRAADLRPMVRLNVSVMMADNDKTGEGSYGFGGRKSYQTIFNEAAWHEAADEAVRQAEVDLRAVPPPAGKMTVVLSPGWPGVMVHEAVGHGLEGDFNAKRISAFSAAKSDPSVLGRIGQQVASPEVTVIDDGTDPSRRGSINIDDEGSPSQKNVLIDHGILTSYMQDIISGQKMGVASTGNGRRENYSSAVMPRMTNTYIANGPHTPEDIIKSVEHGIYAVNFAGGQVEIESGDFVFKMSEAYMIEHGVVQWDKPLKGATMAGNGPFAMLEQVTMVGNDSALDRGIGSCGKSGQWVPVGVGTPTLRMDNVLVGGQGGPAGP